MRGPVISTNRGPYRTPSKSHDKKYFSRTAGAGNVNRLNGSSNPMRGGYRL